MQTPEEKKRLDWGRGRMAFLAQRERITQMLAEGWPQTMIYRELQPHLNGLSYSQFSVHIRKNILKTPESPVPQPAITATKALPASKDISPAQPDSPRKTGFKSFIPGPTEPDPKELW